MQNLDFTNSSTSPASSAHQQQQQHHHQHAHGSSTTATTTTTGTTGTTPALSSSSSSTSCESALTLACENGHTDVVDALVKAGADPDQGDPEKGFTPLMKAARAGQLCTVQYLLLNCATAIDINRCTGGNEHNALSLACQNGHLRVVELLLQYGANPLHVFKDNSNCLIEAAKGGHTKIVELLIDWNYTLTQQQQQQQQLLAATNNGNSLDLAIACGEQDETKACPNDFITSDVSQYLQFKVPQLFDLNSF